MFFNKTFNLVYGRFLAEYANQCEIIYYKQPSRVYNVEYRKIAKELWQTGIFDKYPEDASASKRREHCDTKIKKQIMPLTVYGKHCIINSK